MKWQPIETAPKDGTRIRLKVDWRNGPQIWPRVWWAGRQWWAPLNTTILGEPTHWMPLSEPPRDSDTRRKEAA